MLLAEGAGFVAIAIDMLSYRVQLEGITKAEEQYVPTEVWDEEEDEAA